MKEVDASDQEIAEKIYLIIGIKVKLHRGLADMYGTISKRLKEQVKRNIDKVPKYFMFKLTDEKADFMVSQNAAPSRKYFGGSLPYVFSEHEILMLTNVIKSQRAIGAMSIKIIEVFVKFREMLASLKDLLLSFLVDIPRR
jgi:hypothetical protein